MASKRSPPTSGGESDSDHAAKRQKVGHRSNSPITNDQSNSPISNDQSKSPICNDQSKSPICNDQSKSPISNDQSKSPTTNELCFLESLSLEVLCKLFQYLPLQDLIKLDSLSNRLREAVSLHLKLLKDLQLSENRILGPMPVKITDDVLLGLVQRCPNLEIIHGLFTGMRTVPRLKTEQSMSVQGVIEVLEQCKKLKSVELDNVYLLEAVLSKLPAIRILGSFINHGGTFPINDDSFSLSRNPKVRYLHLTGVTIPELPRMDNIIYLYMRWVKFTDPNPFSSFMAPCLHTFVMNNCAGPANALKYVPLVTRLAASRALRRLELVRVPFLGGLFQHVLEDTWKFGGFSSVENITFGACKYATEVDLGHLILTCAEKLFQLIIQPSLTKDNLFLALSLAESTFPRIETLQLGFVDAFPQQGVWTNADLTEHGLSDMTEHPPLITDTGIQLAAKLFGNLRNLIAYNCPYIRNPMSWLVEDGTNLVHLRFLHLHRCHSIRLSEFARFIPELPALESIYLENMFKEMPRGCAHVGLSAGTALGVSSAFMTNQDSQPVAQSNPPVGPANQHPDPDDESTNQNETNESKKDSTNQRAGSSRGSVAVPKVGAVALDIAAAASAACAGTLPGGVGGTAMTCSDDDDPHTDSRDRVMIKEADKILEEEKTSAINAELEENPHNTPSDELCAVPGCSNDKPETKPDKPDTKPYPGKGKRPLGKTGRFAKGKKRENESESACHEGEMNADVSDSETLVNDESTNERNLPVPTNRNARILTNQIKAGAESKTNLSKTVSHKTVLRSNSGMKTKVESSSQSDLEIESECNVCRDEVLSEAGGFGEEANSAGKQSDKMVESCKNEIREHSDSPAVSTTSCQAVSTTSCQAVSTTSCQPVSTTSCQAVSTTNCQPVSTTSCQAVSTTSCQPVSTTSCQAVSTTSCQAVSTTSCQPVTITSCQAVSTGLDCDGAADKYNQEEASAEGENSPNKADNTELKSATSSIKSAPTSSSINTLGSSDCDKPPKTEEDGSTNSDSWKKQMFVKSESDDNECDSDSDWPMRTIGTQTVQSKQPVRSDSDRSDDELAVHQSCASCDSTGHAQGPTSTNSSAQTDRPPLPIYRIGRPGQYVNSIPPPPRVLPINSRSLVSVTLYKVGLEEISLKDCPQLTTLHASACRVLQTVSIRQCPELYRLTIAQCPLFDHLPTLRQIVDIKPVNKNRLVFLRPMNQFETSEIESVLFGGNTGSHGYVVQDHSMRPSLTVHNKPRFEETVKLMSLINKSLLGKRYDEKTGVAALSSNSNYPWGRDIHTTTGESEDGSGWDMICDLAWMRELNSTCQPTNILFNLGPTEHKKGLYNPKYHGHTLLVNTMKVLRDVIAEFCTERKQVLFPYTTGVYINTCDTSGSPVPDDYV